MDPGLLKVHVHQEDQGFWAVDFWMSLIKTMPREQELIDQIKTWCYNAFGPQYCSDISNCRWLDDISTGVVRFRDSRDLQWFLARWAS